MARGGPSRGRAVGCSSRPSRRCGAVVVAPTASSKTGLPVRALGPGGLSVPGLGLGCMVLSSAYDKSDKDQSARILRAALDAGITFFDTADVYADGENEQLIGQVLGPAREGLTLATKGGIERDGRGRRRINGSPMYLRAACEASLRRLGRDSIELYYLHRADPVVPIESSVAALAQLVDEGKIQHIGLCEPSAETLSRAHMVHPVTAVQSEWSLWCRDIEIEVLPRAQQLGAGIVPFSPLGRGFLAGAVASPAALAESDFRRGLPRFSAKFLPENRRRLDEVRAVARATGLTLAQLALYWLITRASCVVPITGTQSIEHLRENLTALTLDLDADQSARIGRAADFLTWVGPRYPWGYRSYGNTPRLRGQTVSVKP